MKLEYGKRYVTRGGEITLALMNSGNEDYPFYGIIDDEGFSWNGGGLFMEGADGHLDLVSEYTEPTTEEPTEPQPGLTKREFVQKFVISRAGLRKEYRIHEEIDRALFAWHAIEKERK